ncbi:MAG: sensory box histidine kinase/response regulator, partial [Verrucomicrobiales bacterium]|nr:sensory box histidine kinase/response regulator [Verrucomicrobiales bacterium]
MTALLRETDLNNEQQDFVQTIRSSSDALLTIINDILDFSKIEAGKLHFETIDFDLHQAAEGAVGLLAERAHAKGVELAFYIEPSAPRNLREDCAKF